MDSSGEAEVTDQHRRSRVAAIATESPWLLVVLFVALGFYSVAAPAPRPADAPAGEFSANRAIDHVAAIAQQPHPMGSAEIAEVRAYIVSELRSLGLEPDLHRTDAPDYFGDEDSVEIVNVIARLPGSQGQRTVALMAHYDTVPETSGANDNSAAVATLLEAARVISNGPPVAHDVVLLFTDGEEPSPRFGATAFVDERSAAENIGFVVNFEAIGGSGASLLVETSGPESWIIEHYSAAVERPAAFSFATEIARLMGDIGTDFDPFRNAGVPGLHFAYMRGSPIYHTSADNIESVSLRSLQHHGDAAVGVIRHFGNLDLRPERSNGTPTYFTVGPLLIKYPAWAAWVGLLAAAALLVAALRRARLSLGRVVAAAGRNAAGILGATIVATLLWILATAVRNTPSAAEAYALLFLIGGFALWVAHRLVGGERNSEFLPGTAVIWIALSLVTVLFLPGSSYLFVWPALAAAIALSVEPLSRGRFVGFVAVAAIALLLLTPAVEFFFQLGQPRPGNPDSSIPAVAVVAFLFVVLGGRLLRGVWWKPSIGSGPFTAPPPPRLERPSET